MFEKKKKQWARSQFRHSQTESNTRSREKVVPRDQRAATLMLEHLTGQSRGHRKQEQKVLTGGEFPFSAVGLADDRLASK